MLLGVTQGAIVVGTARNSTVPVKIAVFEAEPPFNRDEQQQLSKINECELTISSGAIIVAGLTDYQPTATRLTLQKGVCRARIYYYNLDELSEDALEGSDNYFVQLWQTTTAGSTPPSKGNLLT